MSELSVTLPRLHLGQEKIRARLRERRFVVVMCGRRFGKTKYGVREACDYALDGKRVGWFAPTYKYAQEAWREISQRVRPACANVSAQEKRLETLTGGVIEVWTLDSPDPARGRFYDLVILDEAGIVRDLMAIWQSAVRPTLTDRRGKALFLGTPKGRGHGFSVLFAKGESDAKDWASVRAATVDNPYIAPEEIEDARSELPPGVFAQEYEGIPADDGGNPFSIDAIRACCTLDVLSDRPSVSWGWDFARAQDWTVGLGLDAYGHQTAAERWQQRPWDWTVREVARLTGDIVAHGDSTGIGDVVVEGVQKAGVRMVGVKFSAPEKQKLMERLAVAIQGRQLALVKGGWLQSELESFTYEYTSHGVRYTAPDGLHDDGVMALALAVRGWDWRGVPPVGVERTPEDFHRHPGFTPGQHQRRDQVRVVEEWVTAGHRPVVRVRR